MMGEDSAGSSSGSGPSSEGYTALLSNGGELLLLLEHCRVVVDNVVDAPQALLAAGNIENAALEWQKKISWFQARFCGIVPRSFVLLAYFLAHRVSPTQLRFVFMQRVFV